ncbi:MAG TPA: hypothetical protein VGV35_02465, partial [Bryobacteraceae bacterium]|nr:hypothetical protein [Bryobacteraceae bacterium]
ISNSPEVNRWPACKSSKYKASGETESGIVCPYLEWMRVLGSRNQHFRAMSRAKIQTPAPP